MEDELLLPNKSLQATATGRPVLTMTQNLIMIIPVQARLPWLRLSFGR